MNFMWGPIQNLNGIELENNVGVAILQYLFHMVRHNNFQGEGIKPLEGMLMILLSEPHVKFLEIHGN